MGVGNKSLLRWWEEWDEAVGELPRELNDCGWKCPFCDTDLGNYLTEATGEAHYLDNFDNPPKLNFCPHCGKSLIMDKNSLFYIICRHGVSIMDGWIPVPSTWLSHLTGMSLYQTRKKLKELKEQGLVDSDLWVEPGEERPILVRGYIVTEKGKQTEEYREAYEEERELCKKCLHIDIGEMDALSIWEEELGLETDN